MSRMPLFPHVAKTREVLYPHVPEQVVMTEGAQPEEITAWEWIR